MAHERRWLWLVLLAWLSPACVAGPHPHPPEAVDHGVVDAGPKNNGGETAGGGGAAGTGVPSSDAGSGAAVDAGDDDVCLDAHDAGDASCPPDDDAGATH